MLLIYLIEIDFLISNFDWSACTSCWLMHLKSKQQSKCRFPDFSLTAHIACCAQTGRFEVRSPLVVIRQSAELRCSVAWGRSLLSRSSPLPVTCHPPDFSALVMPCRSQDEIIFLCIFVSIFKTTHN